jgi:hypothetical protein
MKLDKILQLREIELQEFTMLVPSIDDTLVENMQAPKGY